MTRRIPPRWSATWPHMSARRNAYDWWASTAYLAVDAASGAAFGPAAILDFRKARYASYGLEADSATVVSRTNLIRDSKTLDAAGGWEIGANLVEDGIAGTLGGYPAFAFTSTAITESFRRRWVSGLTPGVPYTMSFLSDAATFPAGASSWNVICASNSAGELAAGDSRTGVTVEEVEPGLYQFSQTITLGPGTTQCTIFAGFVDRDPGTTFRIGAVQFEQRDKASTYRPVAQELEMRAFEDLIPFTRPGTATYVDADGLVKTAAADQPRFDYTNGRRQLLLEGPATNTALYSEDFSQWTTINATATVAEAPDGSTNAVLLVPAAGTRETIQSNINGGGPVNPGVQYTYSVFVKSAGLDVGIIRFSDRPNVYGGVAVDLHDGTVLDVGGGNDGTITNAGSTYIGGGLWRIYFTHEGNGALDATNNISISGCPYIAGENIDYVDYTADLVAFDGVAGIRIWGVQREPGAVATSYIPTAGSAVTRPADKAQLAEPVAALLRNGEASVLVQGEAIRGADGRLIGGGNSSRMLSINGIQTAINPDGWSPVSLTVNSDFSSDTDWDKTGDVSWSVGQYTLTDKDAWISQQLVGVSAGDTVEVTIDVLSTEGGKDFLRLYLGTAVGPNGTGVYVGSSTGKKTVSFVAIADDPWITAYSRYDGIEHVIGGLSVANPFAQIATPTQPFGLSLGYDASGKRGSFNNGAVAFDAVAMDADLTTVFLGRDSVGNHAPGWYDQLVIWPFRMTDADLQAKAVPYA